MSTIKHLMEPTTAAHEAHGVSTLTACYRCDHTVADTVRSIYVNRPLERPLQIVLADDSHKPTLEDGSPNPNYTERDRRTSAILRQLVEHYSQLGADIVLVDMGGNKGLGAARNACIQAAHHENIMPLDADDQLESGSRVLSKAATILDTNPDVMCVAPTVQRFGDLSGRQRPPRYNERTQLLENILPVFSMYRRSEALGAGCYDPTVPVAEDWDFWARLINYRYCHMPQHKRDVVRLDDAVRYRAHATGSNLAVTGRLKMGMMARWKNTAKTCEPIFRNHFRTIEPKRLRNSFLVRRAVRSACRRMIEVMDGARFASDFGVYGRLLSRRKQPPRSEPK